MAHGALSPLSEREMFGQEIGEEPEVGDDLRPAIATWQLLGHDQDGRPLFSEMVAVLDEERVEDELEREWWIDLWTVLSGERRAVAAEKAERMQREIEQSRRNT